MPYCLHVLARRGATCSDSFSDRCVLSYTVPKPTRQPDTDRKLQDHEPKGTFPLCALHISRSCYSNGKLTGYLRSPTTFCLPSGVRQLWLIGLDNSLFSSNRNISHLVSFSPVWYSQFRSLPHILWSCANSFSWKSQNQITRKQEPTSSWHEKPKVRGSKGYNPRPQNRLITSLILQSWCEILSLESEWTNDQNGVIRYSNTGTKIHIQW